LHFENIRTVFPLPAKKCISSVFGALTEKNDVGRITGMLNKLGTLSTSVLYAACQTDVCWDRGDVVMHKQMPPWLPLVIGLTFIACGVYLGIQAILL
jgi:hypothetical protein